MTASTPKKPNPQGRARVRGYEDGRLHIDNNQVENKIRPRVIGKKNYLFIGSHEAAHNSEVIYSLLISCKANNMNPVAK